MADHADRRRSSSHLLHELDELSRSLYQTNSTRGTTSLALHHYSVQSSTPVVARDDDKRSDSMPRSYRMSTSSYNSRPDPLKELEDYKDDDPVSVVPQAKQQSQPGIVGAEATDKKGIWGWKPMRALSHIRMHRVGCLLSVEVVSIHRLPTSMNGVRLCVNVRKKETKEGAVQTMPSRVLQGSADFEETLFVNCHVYCSGGAGTGKSLKFEPRLFLVSAVAIDAPQLDFGKSTIDLSSMVRESMEKNLEGSRVREWDATFRLSGKAKGGEIVVKLGFQITEDGGLDIYNQGDGAKLTSKGRALSFSYGRRYSKSSFSILSPRARRSDVSGTPVKVASVNYLKGIDEFSLEEPVQAVERFEVQKVELEVNDELDLPDFEVVEKGIEIEEDKEEEALASNEVVKEVVHDPAQLVRLNELDTIAQQIKALESVITEDEPSKSKAPQEAEIPRAEADEDDLRRELAQMLELEDEKQISFGIIDADTILQPGMEDNKHGVKSIYNSDLGKGLGPVVQTRDGGYLFSMNPFDVEVNRKDVPKLAMQISKPFILVGQNLLSGFEVFQKLAAIGSEKLCNRLQSLSSMDELMGKTAEQIAFEGMASAILSGKNKEGASSSAAKIVATLKTMAVALSEGKKERIGTDIWNLREEPVAMDEILAFSLQKMESMAVEALKIQAGIAEEEAPFDVSSLASTNSEHPLQSAMPPEDWERGCGGLENITILVVIQLREPLRRYQTVGAPSVAVIQAARVHQGGKNEEAKFKVTSLHFSGLKLQSGSPQSVWDSEKQRLTALQWLVAYGFGKAGKKWPAPVKGGHDVLWSISSRVIADMWLKTIRNPDVRVSEQ